MRWIDRGPEPQGVQEYAQRFTSGWVQYFQDGIGDRPTDSHWVDFRQQLADCSGKTCWYCERLCTSDDAGAGGRASTVDHFRPLNRFPQLAYEWSNWIFSCRRCNVEYKQGKWPESGYVDPSAPDEQERPEQYFDYDSATGEIIPKSGLSAEARTRALRTIDDLGLNRIDIQRHRLDWTTRFIADWLAFPPSYHPALAQSVRQPGFEFAGATLMAVQTLQTFEQP